MDCEDEERVWKTRHVRWMVEGSVYWVVYAEVDGKRSMRCDVERKRHDSGEERRRRRKTMDEVELKQDEEERKFVSY